MAKNVNVFSSILRSLIVNHIWLNPYFNQSFDVPPIQSFHASEPTSCIVPPSSGSLWESPQVTSTTFGWRSGWLAGAGNLWGLLKLFVTVNNAACIVPPSRGAGAPSRRRLAPQITDTTIGLGTGEVRLNGSGLHCLVAAENVQRSEQFTGLTRNGIFLYLISRPGRSQGLLYKHLCYSLIN